MHGYQRKHAKFEARNKEKKNNKKIIKKLTHPHPQNNPKQTIFKKLILKKGQLVQAFEHVPRDSVK